MPGIVVLNPWYGRIAVLVSLLAFILIRWPHGKRNLTVQVTDNRKDRLEVVLLIGAALGTTFLPMLWLTTSLFAFAEYPLQAVPFAAGIAFALAGLWLFHRSHVDLGLNWSVTLQVRNEHQLVTNGVYARIRHPMYSAMFLMGIAQACFLPNWLIGPAYLVTFGILYLFRVGHEERMMLDHFGEDYEAYRKRTGRVIPRFGKKD